MIRIWCLLIMLSMVLGWTLPSWGNSQSLSVTDTVDIAMQAMSSMYQTQVIDKLQQDGKGASATPRRGFVPPRKDFMRSVALYTVAQQRKLGQQSFKFTLAPNRASYLTVYLKQTMSSPQDQAHQIADVVSNLIRSLRATYTKLVVAKLKRDGTGASIDHVSQNGFVPLPAVFMQQVVAEIAKQTESRIVVSLLSRWNLNEQKGLQDDFDRTGWGVLARQQKNHLDNAGTLSKISWQPYVKVANLHGQNTLRHLSADPAVNASCTSCHNKWEQKDAIKARRSQQGVEVGKSFQLHELLGVLSVRVAIPKG